MSVRTVIIADGTYPSHDIPLGYLWNADLRVCCDGSAESLDNAGFVPDAIVGDLDSLSDELKDRFADRLFIDNEQETNDLTKAVKWCRESGYNDIVILGATGKREDHTLGNISLLAEYATNINVKMVTDSGIFLPFLRSCKVESFPGQQVSLFSIDPETEITSSGLLYPLTGRKLRNWWEATLNEATGDHFELRFEGGRLLVFLKFADPF
ncbi:MAG: thiamine pyrophosphokinae [Bacteroidota bacterium]|nr:thiamine pyrophosphokinae [Bacteroidota bacterium]